MHTQARVAAAWLQPSTSLAQEKKKTKIPGQLEVFKRKKKIKNKNCLGCLRSEKWRLVAAAFCWKNLTENVKRNIFSARTKKNRKAAAKWRRRFSGKALRWKWHERLQDAAAAGPRKWGYLPRFWATVASSLNPAPGAEFCPSLYLTS